MRLLRDGQGPARLGYGLAKETECVYLRERVIFESYFKISVLYVGRAGARSGPALRGAIVTRGGNLGRSPGRRGRAFAPDPAGNPAAQPRFPLRPDRRTGRMRPGPVTPPNRKLR